MQFAYSIDFYVVVLLTLFYLFLCRRFVCRALPERQLEIDADLRDVLLPHYYRYFVDFLSLLVCKYWPKLCTTTRRIIHLLMPAASDVDHYIFIE